MSERICKTCRWWDMYSLDMKAGECRDERRYRDYARSRTAIFYRVQHL